MTENIWTKMKNRVAIKVLLGLLLLSVFGVIATSCKADNNYSSFHGFSDEFENITLDSRWEVIDPYGGSVFDLSVKLGYLTISTTSPPDKDLWQAVNLYAPRILQTVEGNLTIETKVEADWNASIQSGGIVIWKDQNNFLRLERAYRYGHQQILFIGMINGVWSMRNVLNIPAINPTYLRLERKGNIYSGYYSKDGKSWNFIDNITLNVYDPIQIGLYVVNRFNPGVTVSFDYFRIFRDFELQYSQPKSYPHIWWNSDWLYRKQISITENSGFSLESFPVEITFQHDGKIQGDGRDIRIVIEDSEIPYAIEEINQTHVSIIFQIDLEPYEVKTLYVYYGNSKASKPNYLKVPLTISEGQNGYAIIDNNVYLGWSYTKWGWDGDNNLVTLWTDYKIDFNGDGNPGNDMDLITDVSGRTGGIGRHRIDYGNGVVRSFGLGNYLSYVQTPIYVDINFADAILRVYRNHPWVETTQADTLHMYGSSYDHAKYGTGPEENIVDGKNCNVPKYPGWNKIYLSEIDPVWMAFRNSESGYIIASTGLRIGSDYKYTLAAKESVAWGRIIRYFIDFPNAQNYPLAPYDQPSDCRIYWYGDNSNGYSNIERIANILRNKPSILVEGEDIIAPYIVIDEAFVSDQRVNVGSIQTIRFHAKWDNGSDVIGGSIYVNGTRYITDEEGWISFNASSSIVGKKSWGITGVNVNGVTLYSQTVKNPAIIWDNVKAETKIESLIPGNIQVRLKLNYEYDGLPVRDALVWVNGVKAENIGNGIYRVNLHSWIPYLTINIVVNKDGFDPLIIQTSIYALANIIVFSLLTIIILYPISIIKFHERRIQRRKVT